MTNFDYITRTVDRLADFIDRLVDCKECPIREYCHNDENYELDVECNEIWIKWLLEDR